MNSEAVIILMKLRKAKEEVQQLENEYKKVCDCNVKLSNRQFDTRYNYEKLYKTCDYHKVTISRDTKNAAI